MKYQESGNYANSTQRTAFDYQKRAIWVGGNASSIWGYFAFYNTKATCIYLGDSYQPIHSAYQRATKFLPLPDASPTIRMRHLDWPAVGQFIDSTEEGPRPSRPFTMVAQL